MIPTLLVGDYLFVSKWSYGYSRYSPPFGLPLIPNRVIGSMPARGDVAVFKKLTDNETDYIKRVIGLPGDKIQVIKGVLHINGTPSSASGSLISPMVTAWGGLYRHANTWKYCPMGRAI